jgi:hypothetical protein
MVDGAAVASQLGNGRVSGRPAVAAGALHVRREGPARPPQHVGLSAQFFVPGGGAAAGAAAAQPRFFVPGAAASSQARPCPS